MTKTTKRCQSKKIRKGDKVVVIAGNNRGQTGTVVNRVGQDRVVVQGINVRKKHVRPTQENPKGSILDIEMPIHISNIQISDDKGKPARLKVKQTDKGEKVFYYLQDGKEIIHRSVKKHKSS